ncbi:hypothetical protein BDP27DRAFT_459726 [Rhodocollybia butyracea]|uniref:F-box domain-containing protein n=1 Tax=Rhodocollybia butyracea TaxID=206335 RepID=A0A9P5PT20_9AGAR|nr:hypothetical protein BDP27DRAFT_459726 [Rhodocollybia butyracea]
MYENFIQMRTHNEPHSAHQSCSPTLVKQRRGDHPTRCFATSSMLSNNPTIQNSPPELLRSIFSTLTPWELAACALVCRVWLSPAQVCLYEHIDVRRASDKMAYASRSAVLCHTLDATPVLSALLSLLYASTTPSISSLAKIVSGLQTLEKISFHTTVSLTSQDHFLMLQGFGNLPRLRHLRYFAPFSTPVRRSSQFTALLDALPSQMEKGPPLRTLDLRNITELGSFRASLEDLEWAFHPRSPIDLTQLKGLKVSTYRAAKQIMREVSGTLESLTFTSASRILGDTESQPPITLPMLKISLHTFRNNRHIPHCQYTLSGSRMPDPNLANCDGPRSRVYERLGIPIISPRSVYHQQIQLSGIKGENASPVYRPSSHVCVCRISGKRF